MLLSHVRACVRAHLPRFRCILAVADVLHHSLALLQERVGPGGHVLAESAEPLHEGVLLRLCVSAGDGVETLSAAFLYCLCGFGLTCIQDQSQQQRSSCEGQSHDGGWKHGHTPPYSHPADLPR